MQRAVKPQQGQQIGVVTHTMARHAPLLAVALLAWATAAAAMYEDQAGTFDWYSQHVGEVLRAGYAPGRDRFYVATAQVPSDGFP